MPTPQAPSAARPWLGVLLLIVCAGAWSLNGPLIKLLAREGVAGVTIASYRSLFGGLLLLPFVIRRLGTLRNVHYGWSIAGVVTFTVMTVSFVIANTLTAAANAITLQYTAPLWVFLLSPLVLREHPRRAEGVVLLITLAGAGVIFAGNHHTDVLGLIIALISGFSYAMLMMVLRALRPVNPLVVACLNALGSGVALLVPVLALGVWKPTPTGLGLLVFMGIVQFILPYAIFSAALRHIEAYRASLILLLEAILNPLWTYLAVGEIPARATFFGGPLILVGVAAWLLLSWRSRVAVPPVRREAELRGSRPPSP